MIGLPEVFARVRRLEELSRGLSRELMLWQQGGDPLLYLERRSYVSAIQDALAALEQARVVLARAAQRAAAEEDAVTPEPGASATGNAQPVADAPGSE